ncbi:MoaF-related domain-containing protein [Herbaspirillum sp. NPDC087042]|uniref:MoaF-related domain-containing protein n=1 Tax=Herbaspirillum sp. NPDC087042 TaxID=3364004 RepID=UPI00382465AA
MKKILLIAASALSLASLTVHAQATDPHAVPQAADAEFSPTGKSYNVDFGDQQFRLDFKSARQMVFTSPDGKNSATVDINVTPIGNDVYMIYWSRRPGQYVVHVDDFRNGVAYTNIFLPDGKSSRRRGTLVEVK